MKKKKIVRFKFLARKFKNEIQAEVPHFSATQSPYIISPLRATIIMKKNLFMTKSIRA